MKKLLCVITAMLIVISCVGSAFADYGLSYAIMEYSLRKDVGGVLYDSSNSTVIGTLDLSEPSGCCYKITEGTAKIADEAFCVDRCSRYSVFIPKSVKEIGKNPFPHIRPQNIEVSEENDIFYVENDALYNRRDSKLIAVFGKYYEENGYTFEIPEGITSIEDYAFYRCKDLKTVILPDSLKEIGAHAFDECESLESISLPDGVLTIGNYAFSGCITLKNVRIPDTIRSIGEYSFSGCSSVPFLGWTALKSKDILDGIIFDCYSAENGYANHSTEIGEGAFGGCSSMQQAHLPPSVLKLKTGIFQQCELLETVTLNAVDTVLEGNPFPGCTALKKISFDSKCLKYCAENGVLYDVKDNIFFGFYGELLQNDYIPGTLPKETVRFANGVFSYWKALSKIEIPYGIERIPEKAFENSGLAEITIPLSVKEIGNNAFENCYNLITIELPESVDEIGEAAFIWSKLQSIVIPKGITVIKNQTFKYCFDLADVWMPDSLRAIEDEAFYCCNRLESISFPKSLRIIGDYAFRSSSVDELILPESIEAIGKGAFEFCWNLERVIIPDGVKAIEDLTFSGCYKLSSVRLPSKMEIIGNFAFFFCGSLSSVDIPETVVKIGDYAFRDNLVLSEVSLSKNLKILGAAPFGHNVIIHLDPENKYLAVSDDILYDLENKTAIEAFGSYYEENGKEVATFDYAVTEIGCDAFSDSDIKTILFPDTVTEIQGQAFARCTELRDVDIPQSVRAVRECAFESCGNIRDGEFPATVTEISISPFSSNYWY